MINVRVEKDPNSDDEFVVADIRSDKEYHIIMLTTDVPDIVRALSGVKLTKTKTTDEKECTCDSRTLFNFGCQCGAVKPYRAPGS